MQEFIPFFQAERRSIAEKLANYFNSSGLETKIYFDEKRDSYILSIPFRKEKEAKKLYQAFYFAERDRIEKEESSQESINEYNESNILSDSSLDDAGSDTASDEDNDDTPKPEGTAQDEASDDSVNKTDKDSEADNEDSKADDGDSEAADEDSDDALTDTDTEEKESIKSLLAGSGSYVMKSEKYKDYVGTQYIFLLLGAAGFIFVILNAVEILTVLHGLFPNIIMGLLFLFFIYVGLSTGKKAKQLKLEIDEENQLTEKINEWLRANVTEEFLSSISNAELSEELDYIKKTETIREMLINEFGEQNQDYLDRLIEEFYTDSFEESDNYTEEPVE